MSITKSFDTRKLVLLSLLTAIVIVLQIVGAFIKFGPFSISLVLLPIAVGAALVSPMAGGWLGLVFGFVVLVSGDANPFLAVNPAGTIIVVMLKGALAGLAAGAVYRLISNIIKSGTGKTFAAIAAAAVCPIVNTGIFILGSYVFFLPTLREWSAAAGDYSSVTAFIFIGMIGVNFLVELGLNLALSPTIVRLIQYGQDRRAL